MKISNMTIPQNALVFAGTDWRTYASSPTFKGFRRDGVLFLPDNTLKKFWCLISIFPTAKSSSWSLYIESDDCTGFDRVIDQEVQSTDFEEVLSSLMTSLSEFGAW